MNAVRQPLAELDDVAAVFEALAHSARRQILLVLLARGESMSSGEVAERFSTTWATVSRHLKTLESAGLISVVRGADNRERHYVLNRAHLIDVAGGWIAHFDETPTDDTKEGSS